MPAGLLLVLLTATGCGAAPTPAGGAAAPGPPPSPAATGTPSAAPGTDAGLLGSRSATLDALRADQARRPVSVLVPGTARPTPVRARTTDPVTGGLDLPTSAAEAAWWSSGSAPGDPGSVVLAGHVSYEGRTGPFTRLADVGAGAAVVVTSADGSTRGYTVRSTRSAPKTALDRGGLFRTDGPPVLVLVTCGGAYDPATRSYADNVVVTATAD